MKPKRPRINIICSSSNYEDTIKKYKQLRFNYLQTIHQNNIELIEEIKSTIVIDENKIAITKNKQAYIKVFGKLIPINKEEAHKLEKTPNIIIFWD